MNGILSFMAYLASEHLLTGQLPLRTGNNHPLVAPYGLYKASDGDGSRWRPATMSFCAKFMRTIGLEDLLDDPRYDDNTKALFPLRDELKEIIDARMQDESQAHWIAGPQRRRRTQRQGAGSREGLRRIASAAQWKW